MIDNPSQVERLIPKLDESLPVFAGLSAELAAVVRKEAPGIELPQRCRVTSIDYAGDAGGIMCWLDLRHGDASKGFVVSITHLTFDRSQPLGREIAAYQKHRLKRVRRQGHY